MLGPDLAMAVGYIWLWATLVNLAEKICLEFRGTILYE
jgi:hypothetical protein